MLSNGSLLTVLTVTLGILSRTYWGIVLGSYVTCITPSEIVTEDEIKPITMCHKSRSPPTGHPSLQQDIRLLLLHEHVNIARRY